MSKAFEKDLTTGNVWSGLLVFALPFFASNLLQSCFNLADMIILSNFGGTYSLSGVSIGGSVMTILTTLAAGISTGGTVIIGNYLGSGKKEKINSVISTLLISLTLIGLAFMVAIIIGVNPLLHLLNAPNESFDEARKYLIICALGMVFIFGYNAVASIMRGLGDAKTPMYFITIACAINIILDYYLVAVIKLGAMGAALATVLSQALSVISCIIYLKLHDFMFDFKLSSFKFSLGEFKLIITAGLPIGIQSVATNLSFLMLSAFNNTLGGVNASAAVAVVMNFNGFAILPCHAINAATTAMISQNMGKNNITRSKQALHACLAMCIVISATVFVLVRLFSIQIFNLFGSEQAVIDCGIPYLLAFSFEYVGLPFIVAYNAFLTGTGRGWVILLTTLLSSFIFRIPVAYLLGFVLNMGILGVAYAVPIATIVGATLSFVFYMVFRNKPVTLLK